MNRVHRTPRHAFAALSAALLVMTAPPLATAAPQGIDFGDPSVLSQRGQRLALALPYGSAPGERLSVSRFEVVSVKAPDGWAAPDPAGFSLAKPARRNLIYLRSREAVEAPELAVTVRVAEQPDSLQTFTVLVPPARASAQEAGPEPTAAAAAPAPAKAARRTPARDRRTAAR
jgi:hypothetical protein